MIIDQLPNLASVQETDEIPVERGTTTYKTTLQKVKALIASLLTKADIGLANVDNVRQYSADNPPPYPVTSVAGKTGAVDLPITPTWYYEERSVSSTSENAYDYTVNGDGWILATIYIRSDTTNDYGSATASVYQTSISDGVEYARGWASTRTDKASTNEIGAEAVGAFMANNGDSISLLVRCTKSGTKRIRYSIMCFGCTLTAQ